MAHSHDAHRHPHARPAHRHGFRSAGCAGRSAPGDRALQRSSGRQHIVRRPGSDRARRAPPGSLHRRPGHGERRRGGRLRPASRRPGARPGTRPAPCEPRHQPGCVLAPDPEQPAPHPLVPGNPFLLTPYRPADGRWIMASVVYPHLAAKWCRFLDVPPDGAKAAAAIGRRDAFTLEQTANAAGLPACVIRVFRSPGRCDVIVRIPARRSSPERPVASLPNCSGSGTSRSARLISTRFVCLTRERREWRGPRISAGSLRGRAKTQVALRDGHNSQPPSSVGRHHSCRPTTWAWSRSRATCGARPCPRHDRTFPRCPRADARFRGNGL